MGSGLFYHGTREEVRLGDRVAIKRWLRKPLLGRVCYIPGISPKHKELEYEDVRQWAIRLDDGSLLATGYSPQEYSKAGRAIVLLDRNAGGELLPDEVLEGTAGDSDEGEAGQAL